MPDDGALPHGFGVLSTLIVVVLSLLLFFRPVVLRGQRHTHCRETGMLGSPAGLVGRHFCFLRHDAWFGRWLTGERAVVRCGWMDGWIGWIGLGRTVGGRKDVAMLRQTLSSKPRLSSDVTL